MHLTEQVMTTDVDTYLARLHPAQRDTLQRLRATSNPTSPTISKP